MFNSLRNILAASAVAVTCAAETANAQEGIHGFVRTAWEEGRGDTLPNIVLNTTVQDVKFSAAFDAYDPDGEGDNGYRGRLFWLNASAPLSSCGPLGETGNLQIGMLPPFFNTQQTISMQGIMPMIAGDEAIALNGGITGVNLVCSNQIADGTTLATQAYAGSRLGALNRGFGNENGPGYDSLIYGGGFSLSHQWDNSVKAEAGYRLTEFGQGPAGTSRTLHYTYATIAADAGPVDWRIYSERYESTITGPIGDTSTVSTTLYGEARIPLNQNVGLRAVLGAVNDDAIAEAALTIRRGNLTGQIGAAHDFETNKTYPALALGMSF